MNRPTSFTLTQKALAWSVHVFTASGLLAGFMAILAINTQDWRMCMAWLVLCQIIDGIDGTFARIFRVKEVLPHIDGKTIDYVIDFATYAIIPAYLFYEAQLVDDAWRFPCTALILLVSALYYGKSGMVSEDMYFIGFPVMWNMVMFYMIFVFDFSSMQNVLSVLFIAILHFVPIKFVYPSQGKRFKWLTISVTLAFILSAALVLYLYPQTNDWAKGIAIFTGLYYGVMAIYNTWIE